MIDLGINMLKFNAALSLLDPLREYGSGSVHKAVVTDVPYAPHQEYGTSKMAAQPHARPALAEIAANRKYYIRATSSLEAAVDLATMDLQTRIRRKAPVDTGRLRDSYEIVER